MTDHEINVAIAEACGWTLTGTWWIPRAGVGEDIWRDSATGLPQYCTDLNAMREAVNTLELQEAGQFAERLIDVVEATERPRLPWVDAGSFAHINATARQRAEAFLRTIGKRKAGK